LQVKETFLGKRQKSALGGGRSKVSFPGPQKLRKWPEQQPFTVTPGVWRPKPKMLERMRGGAVLELKGISLGGGTSLWKEGGSKIGGSNHIRAQGVIEGGAKPGGGALYHLTRGGGGTVLQRKTLN